MNHMHFGRHHGKMHALTAVLMLTAVMLAANSGMSPRTLAATSFNHNPHGVINSCILSNGATIIRGWAHDPDALNNAYPLVVVHVGTLSQTVKTNVDPYHNNAIGNYLQANWPDAPTGSNTYGFSASFSGLYKGSLYNVSATVLNYGAGANDNGLKVDTVSSQPDGIAASNLFNDNNTVPDACLNTKPVTPSPPPTGGGSTGGTGGGTSTGGGSTGGTSTGGSKNTGGSSAAGGGTGTTGVNSPADGSVAAGTLNAVITVPSDGATAAYIQYGTSPDNLDTSSDTGDLSSGSADIELDGLQPKTDYYYQIIRQNSNGASGVSSTAGFKTAGYTVSLHFVDGKGKAVSGISGALDDADKTSAKSNKEGNLVFANLDAGQYNVTYHYGKLNYTQPFDTDNGGDGTDNPGKTIELKDTVNVSKLTGGSTAGYSGPKHHSVWGVVLLILFLIVLAVGAVLWWLRRRNAALYGGYSPAASYGAMTPDIVDKPTPVAPVQPAPKKRKADTPPEHLEHVGESLRDMVIQSMHEEAQKRKQNRP